MLIKKKSKKKTKKKETIGETKTLLKLPSMHRKILRRFRSCCDQVSRRRFKSKGVLTENNLSIEGSNRINV